MRDKNRLKILQSFVNDLSITEGSGLIVTLGEHHTSIKSADCEGYVSPRSRYEDAVTISNLLQGAEQLMYWIERNGYKLVRRAK